MYFVSNFPPIRLFLLFFNSTNELSAISLVSSTGLYVCICWRPFVLSESYQIRKPKRLPFKLGVGHFRKIPYVTRYFNSLDITTVLQVFHYKVFIIMLTVHQ